MADAGFAAFEAAEMMPYAVSSLVPVIGEITTCLLLAWRNVFLGAPAPGIRVSLKVF
jgi:hypothetical protein